ncbi:unnamed protein product (macronuclear) [Paramecium tetraurelia]|uniref:Calmodulin n=1 Tax=Paramecium tetraurelia TaxID=5888 RepID=A0BKS7_PARTE|nr:uncharacterized protein GSPATT00029775001 [Paramecium tetraurelia]CAK59144.1 unnamed protein product [Paramecium tetraurelia]|eukprot:XP_001426542.1 hypothetical protein (macronuclear) [Paramecium tetraurelia strain d4-2]
MNQINPDQILSSEEVKAAKDAFEAYDKMGYGTLEVEELQKILEEFGHKPSKEELQQMITQVDVKNKGFIDFEDFKRAIAIYKIIEEDNEEDDTLDAFVAMGGNADKSGTVDATKLIQVRIIIIQIIKSDFKMTIDIEVKMHKYELRD